MDDENNVNLDTQNETVEETEETPIDIILEDETSDVDVEQLQATNKKLFERAKKAEAEVRALRPKSTEAKVSPQPNVDERILLAQGLPEELL